MSNFLPLLKTIRRLQQQPEGFLPLHAPVFAGHERDYVLDALQSTFVSSVGAYVTRFEDLLCQITGATHAVACVNGTSALQVALQLAGVLSGDVVITQALSFVATANAISHAGAAPAFCDVNRESLALSPWAVKKFLQNHCTRHQDGTYLKVTGQRIAACVPMHSFGLPCQILDLCALCEEWGIPVVEDAAEALGSLYHGQHCGTFGKLGILSFNGNKICTCGGGGAILTNDSSLAAHAKSLTTTAKVPHVWEFFHNEVAWNFRMPNLNAALGCAQLEQLWNFVTYKRHLANTYAEFFAEKTSWSFMQEPEHSRSNYWLCAVLTSNRQERDNFLQVSNASGVMTRPAWEPLHTLPMYAACHRDSLQVTEEIASRLINIPSSYRSASNFSFL